MRGTTRAPRDRDDRRLDDFSHLRGRPCDIGLGPARAVGGRPRRSGRLDAALAALVADAGASANESRDPLGDLLVELRRLASWIGPSSPLSLLTDPSWLTRPGTSAAALAYRLLLMLVLQLVFIALALAGAVASLKSREPHPNTWDTYRGYRPPVSDDPIYWREFVLPWRGNRGPVIFIQMRYMWIMIRGILVMLMQLALYTLAVVVPISMLIAVGYFGFRAFEEMWANRSFATGAFQARTRFNLCVRFVTAMLGVVPLVSIPALLAARFTLERDKKTWDSLLLTSLTGPEIISAKARATGQGTWRAGRWLIPLWLLAVACGSVHPLGALNAAVALLVMAWAGFALGAWAGLRPGSTTQAATSVSSLWSIALLVVGALLIIAPLCSVREFAIFWSWDARVRWPIIALLPSVLIATGFGARSLTRRCYQNFDRWVGRPHRQPGAGNGQVVVHTPKPIAPVVSQPIPS